MRFVGDDGFFRHNGSLWLYIKLDDASIPQFPPAECPPVKPRYKNPRRPHKLCRARNCELSWPYLEKHPFPIASVLSEENDVCYIQFLRFFANILEYTDVLYDFFSAAVRSEPVSPSSASELHRLLLQQQQVRGADLASSLSCRRYCITPQARAASLLSSSAIANSSSRREFLRLWDNEAGKSLFRPIRNSHGNKRKQAAACKFIQVFGQNKRLLHIA